MSAPRLLVDGRLLDDRHPGVRDFWIPVLEAWAGQGGDGAVVHRRGSPPPAALVAAGFAPVALRSAVGAPRGRSEARRVVATTKVSATLSPLYLTLDGASRNLATVFDLTGRKHPRSWRSRLLWEAAMRWTIRGASCVVCATTATATELAASFPALRGRTAIVSAVAPPAPHPADVSLARLGVVPPYALVVASHRPHKRLAELARAWSCAAPGVALVLAGEGTQALDATPGIRGLGFVSNDTLAALLARAGCLVSASLAEGFGLPVLAAFTAGVPVAATHVPALDEVAGDAVDWCAPDDLAGLIAAAVRAIRQPNAVAAQIERGRARAGAFTATRAAQRLAQLLT